MKEQEEEAVISNDDINSCNELEDNSNINQISEEIWGTWEELVLTCAVQRYALDWDSIAKEVQIRVRTSLIATSINCEVKYQDLKRRFQDSVDDGGEITWLEELKSIYVSELRRDIERYDESILSLQLKVKRLEEETDGDDGDKKPDLENDEIKTARIRREITTEENRSMNESGTSGGGNGDLKLTGDKSQSLIDIIKLIRSHPHGSVFESRLRSQETKHYKSLIRQHMDIKTIEKKIKKGSYDSSNISFYRDLKLIYTNAIVFFPKSSSESMAAQELRTLVSNEMKKRSQSVIKTEDESSVSRQKEKPSVLPLVVCKNKSSGSKKSSPSSSVKQKDEKVSEEKTVTTVNTTTTTRSTRRTSKETKKGKATKNTKTESSNDDDDKEEESSKTEKKKTVTSKKKKSVEDFLKRIEKNSPEKVKETKSKNQKKINGSVEKKESNVKPRELRSNSKSTSKQKQTKETVSKATGKRSRESGKDDKQPKKRSRR